MAEGSRKEKLFLLEDYRYGIQLRIIQKMIDTMDFQTTVTGGLTPNTASIAAAKTKSSTNGPEPCLNGKDRRGEDTEMHLARMI